MAKEALIPKEKMSKKARKAMNDQRRTDWQGVKPVTRVIPDKRRKLAEEQARKDHSSMD